MKITIDTNNKTITLNESINLGELYSELESMLPDYKWHDYTIISHTIVTIRYENPFCQPIISSGNPV